MRRSAASPSTPAEPCTTHDTMRREAPYANTIASNAREGRLRAHALKPKKGPRGDPVPPRALVAFMRRLNAHRSPSAFGGGMLRAGSFCVRGAVSCMRGLSSFRGSACSFGCSLHRQGTVPECDLWTPLECETRSRGAPCLLTGCELARFAAVGGCLSPCFIVAHIASRLPLIHPVSMEYLLLSGSAD